MLGHDVKGCKSSSPTVEGDLQYGDWLRAKGGFKGWGSWSSSDPPSANGGGGGGAVGRLPNYNPGDALRGEQSKESNNGVDIRGNLSKDNGSLTVGGERGNCSKSQFQNTEEKDLEGERGSQDQQEFLKEGVSIISLNDTKTIILRDPCMDMGRIPFEDCGC